MQIGMTGLRKYGISRTIIAQGRLQLFVCIRYLMNGLHYLGEAFRPLSGVRQMSSFRSLPFQSSLLRIPVSLLTMIGLLAVAAPARAESPNIMFIMDVSGSMRAKMGKEARMTVAKRAYGSLMDGMPSDAHVGLFVYGHHGDRDCKALETLVPLNQHDAAAMKAAVKDLKAAKGATPLTGALMLSVQAVGNYKRPGGKAIVLISDGKENCGGDPVKFVTEMTKGLNGAIKVYVVGLGVNDKERAQLAAIAKAGGGEYHSANNAKQLAEGLGKIKAKLIRKNLFVETFDGPGLKDGLRVLNDKPDARVLDGGKLTMVTGPGSITKNTLKNMIVYEGPAAKADFDVTADLALELQEGRPYRILHSAGMMLMSPGNLKDRLAFFVYGTGEGDGYRYRAKFVKVSGGKQLPGNAAAMGRLGKKQSFSLKIEKRGFKYTAYVKPAGAKKWIKAGNQSFLGKKLVPGLYTWRNQNAPEVLVEFDKFQVDSIEK